MPKRVPISTDLPNWFSRKRAGRVILAATAGACIVIWTILLPRIGNHAPLRESIDRRHALGVNADAMFYTELEAMETLVIEWPCPNP